MRIGIDARFYGPESKGLGRYTQALLHALAQVDQENTYIVFMRRNEYDSTPMPGKNFFKVCADYKWYGFAEQLFLPWVLYKQKLDLMHFPHFNVPLLYRKKTIITIHDLILLHFPTAEGSTLPRWFYALKFLGYRLVIWNAVRSAQKIIAVSEFTRDDLCAKYRWITKKTQTIYEAHFADHKQLLPTQEAQDIVQKRGIMEPYILYVGNAYPHKNVAGLLQAFLHLQKRHRNIGLVLVGKKDAFYKRIQEMIVRTGAENVHILDTVDDRTLLALYQRSQVFAFPSLYEGFGLPPLEALALGVPVVSSEHACMREILGNAAVFAPAEDPTHFAQALQHVIEDTALQQDLKERGARQAQLFSWRRAAQETYNLYNEILAPEDIKHR